MADNIFSLKIWSKAALHLLTETGSSCTKKQTKKKTSVFQWVQFLWKRNKNTWLSQASLPEGIKHVPCKSVTERSNKNTHARFLFWECLTHSHNDLDASEAEGHENMMHYWKMRKWKLRFSTQTLTDPMAATTRTMRDFLLFWAENAFCLRFKSYVSCSTES